MNAIEKLSQFKTLDIPAIARKTIKDNAREILRSNRQQMAQGLTSEGTPTTLLGRTEYAPLTVQLKSEKTGLAAVTDRITGFDTGSLYSQMYIDVQGEQIEYGSKSESARYFEARAGDEIYGLTDENRIAFIQTTLKPAFIAEVSKVIG